MTMEKEGLWGGEYDKRRDTIKRRVRFGGRKQNIMMMIKIMRGKVFERNDHPALRLDHDLGRKYAACMERDICPTSIRVLYMALLSSSLSASSPLSQSLLLPALSSSRSLLLSFSLGQFVLTKYRFGCWFAF